MNLTKAQRLSLRRVHQRHCPKVPYLGFRRSITPLIGTTCLVVQVPGMIIGIERDGYAHT